MVMTLETIHEDLVGLKKEVHKLKLVIEEDLELADDVIEEINLSRRRRKCDFISHEVMRKEFA